MLNTMQNQSMKQEVSRRAVAEPLTPLTIKGATVGTSAFLPTLIRDPLLQAPLLQVGQARPLQEI